MDQDLITKVAVGIASIGAGIYAVIRMLKSDRREDNKADLTDSATQQVITTLREEVARLSDRLAAVEEQNRKCEEANDALREELIAMKKQLHLF